MEWAAVERHIQVHPFWPPLRANSQQRPPSFRLCPLPPLVSPHTTREAPSLRGPLAASHSQASSGRSGSSSCGRPPVSGWCRGPPRISSSGWCGSPPARGCHVQRKRQTEVKVKGHRSQVNRYSCREGPRLEPRRGDRKTKGREEGI